ncbi:peptidylprolyl isomerase [Pelotomaculum propionicicum]|uniref:peptidylprolyl isomerase n=1 Tax=Pelotomaculum propionicicum TaxID=258475 RepID=UPI003B75EB0D
MADKAQIKKNIKKTEIAKKTASNKNANIKGAKGSKGKSSGTVKKSRKSSGDGKRIRNMMIIAVVALIVLIAVAAAYWINQKAPGETPTEAHTVTMQTTKGAVTIEVYPDKMPVTVANFEKLVKSNFYNGLTFHRVEDWVIQGGDPKGDGTGGPGWTIPLETSPDLENERGAVAMARSQEPDSAGSQFYILKNDAAGLNGKYAVFGRVIQGMDVVDQIKAGDKMESVSWDQ